MKHRLLFAAFASGLIAGLILASFGCLRALSPHEETETTVTTGDVEASGGSSVWQFNFTQLSGKAGWFMPVVLLGWMWTERRKRQTTTALDEVIASIESKECVDCKRCVEAKANKLVNDRVAKMKNGKV